MAKLSFYYSAMGGGKSSALIQTIYNYEQNFQNVLLLKLEKDTKGGSKITSRTGMEKEVDIVLGANEKILSEKYLDKIINSGFIFVDEVQFLSASQIDELWMITKQLNIPVTGYGLKTNFKSELFPGSKRMIELADDIKEIDTIPLCSCGNKARFNARKVNGVYVNSGDVVEIDGANDNIVYESLCGKCYLEKVYSKKSVKR